MFGGLLKSTSLAALVAVAGIAASGSANAADLGGNCCADLEERIAELEATTARKGNRKVSLTVSGFVNEAVMVWDDGVETNAYQVTNNTARTRFRFVGNAKINADWSAGYLLEIGVRASNSGAVSQNADDAAQGLDLRHSAWWLQSKQLGRVWVGQTSSAADGITEINLANLGHVLNPSALQDHLGGFLMRRADGSLSPRTVANLTGTGNSAPGEGDRFNVVKYETPTIMGFIGSAAWGEDDMWDVSLRYGGEFNGIKLAAGIAYQQWTDGGSIAANAAPERACSRVDGRSASDCEELGLSASIMHVPTGLFVTGAYGYREDNNRKFITGLVGTNAEARDEFYHIMAGIEQKFVPLGKTTVYGEYYEGNFGAAVNNATGAAGVQGFSASRAFSDVLVGGAGQIAATDVTTWGLGLNQSIDAAAMDIYVMYRNTQFDVTSTTGAKANLEDIQHVMMGARIQF